MSDESVNRGISTDSGTTSSMRTNSPSMARPTGPAFRHEAVAVVFQVRDTENGASLHVLTRRRERPPFDGELALPSGPVHRENSILDSTLLHLRSTCDPSSLRHIEQLSTYSAPGRDPNQRTIATAYVGYIPHDIRPELPQAARWVPVDAVGQLAFGHEEMVRDGLKRTRSKLSYSNLAFALAPATFTLAELREIYSATLGYEVEVTNLQRVLTRRNQLHDTGERRSSGRGRPAAVYQFAMQQLAITDPFATLRPTEAS